MEQVGKELAENYLPPLKTNVEDIEAYGTVFIGTPTWEMHLPPVAKSFLHENNLSGKTVIPFNTQGSVLGDIFNEIKELCPNSTVLEGFSTEGGTQESGPVCTIEGNKAAEVKAQVLAWLQQLACDLQVNS
ncbi:MAG: flavodoxin [Micrococcaceae bacterium]